MSCAKVSRESQGSVYWDPSVRCKQSVRLTSFPSSTERELGLVLLTKGIGVVQNRRAFRHKSYVQKQLSDVMSYREEQLQHSMSSLQGGNSRLNNTV